MDVAANPSHDNVKFVASELGIITLNFETSRMFSAVIDTFTKTSGCACVAMTKNIISLYATFLGNTTKWQQGVSYWHMLNVNTAHFVPALHIQFVFNRKRNIIDLVFK